MSTETIDRSTESADIDRDTLAKTVTQRAYLSISLAIVLLVDAGLMYGDNVWAAYIAAIIGVIQLIIAGTLPTRIADRKHVQDMGNVAVQHSWLLLSVGVAVLAIYPSPFFRIPQIWFAVAMLTGIAWVIIGAGTLYLAVSKANARFTI